MVKHFQTALITPLSAPINSYKTYSVLLFCQIISLLYRRKLTYTHTMLPLYLLTSIKGQAIMIELKSGETINGTLNNCDSWMNLTLDDAITVDTHGVNFSKLKEVYIRGNQIKYMRMSNEIIDKFKEQQQQQQQQQPYNNNNNYHHSNNSQGGQRYQNYNNNSQAGQGQRYNSNSDNRGGYGQRRNYNNQGRGQHQSRGGNYQHRDSNAIYNDK